MISGGVREIGRFEGVVGVFEGSFKCEEMESTSCGLGQVLVQSGDRICKFNLWTIEGKLGGERTVGSEGAMQGRLRNVSGSPACKRDLRERFEMSKNERGRGVRE